MPDNTHRIMRQILELDFGPTDQYSEVQQVAAQVWQNHGLAILETVFDQVAGPQERVRLDRLELDLGTLHGPDWPEQFSQRLAEQLQRQLGPTRQNSAVTISTTTPTTDSLFEQFLYFCQQGRLPWWERQAVASWVEALPNTLTIAQWQTLVNQVQQDRRVRQRLIYTVSDDFLQMVLQRFSQLPAAAQIRQQLSPAAGSATTQARWRVHFWSILLRHTPVRTTAAGVTLMRQLLATRQQVWERDAAPPPGAPAARMRDRSPHSLLTDLPVLPAPWQRWLDQAIQTNAPNSLATDDGSATRSPPTILTNSAWTAPEQASRSEPADIATPAHSPRSPMLPEEATTLETTAPETTAPETTTPETTAAIASDPAAPANHPASDPPGPPTETPQPITDTSVPGTIKNPTSRPAEATPPFTESAPDIGEAVYIDAAGMVILHPFLQELFNSLDLLRDRQFSDVVAQRRAVALLIYLAFGDLPVPEYKLLLPKLLVNWPWAEPLPPDDLTGVEREACDELMAAVLQHWSALRSSSADWLREAFFWRDGKLTPVDDGWRLTIERQAQDVLLNRLPWGVGVIQLPWMADFLYVSWIN